MTTLEKLEELIYVGFKETDRKIEESDRKFREELEERDRKSREELEERYRKFREELKANSDETARISRNTELELQKLSVQVRNITDSLGRFAENMIAPAVLRIFNDLGIPITDYAQRLYSPKHRIEFDIIAFDDDYVVVVSVKMTLRPEDVRHFLKERLPIFKELFPRYKDMKVIGAVAGASIVGESDRYAINQGLYVLTQSGENVILLNTPEFKPRIF